MCEQVNNTTLNKNPQPFDTQNKLKKFEITVRDTTYIIALLLTSILISSFGIFGGFRGGFTVTAIIQTVVISLYILGKGYEFKLFPTICLILGLGIAFIFLITSNGAVRFCSFVLFFLLNLVWFTSTVRDEAHSDDAEFFFHLVSPLVEMLINIPTMFVSLFSKKNSVNKTAGKIFIGILFSLPTMLIIIPLLMSSDQAFKGMVSFILEQTGTIIIRSLIGIIISIFIISYALSLKKDHPLIKKNDGILKIDSVVIISFLSVLSVCYLSYLFSQLAYFFDAFGGFLPQGYEFTFADYARRGFFEMTVIASINLIIIFICQLLGKRENKKYVITINILSTFIGGFTLLIIATALSKMILYIENYGMTKLRITTSMFMVFLAVVFITLMLRLYIKRINVIKLSFITAAISLILLGFFNVNSVVAKYNYTAYKENVLKEIDINTIAELGDEGIPYLVLLADDENKDISKYASYKLSLTYDDYYNLEIDEYGIQEIKDKKHNEIGQFSIARQKAYKELEKYSEKNPLILEYKDRYFDSVKTNIW